MHGQRCARRYNIVVDGNGAPDRLAATLCAGSVALKATLFKEWYYNQLRPYVHYLPIRLDYADLPDQLDWAKDNQDRVRLVSSGSGHLIDWPSAASSHWGGGERRRECPPPPSFGLIRAHCPLVEE